MTRVLLYSGGMDSEALRLLWPPDVLLYVDIGGRYSQAERRRLPAGTEVVDLPLGQFERPDGIVPMRNLLFVTIASIYGDRVALGATAGDRVLDKTYEFAARAGDLLGYLWQPQHWTDGKGVTVELPLKHLTKRRIVAEVAAAGHDLDGLAARSFSCYDPTPGAGLECGRCKPCVRKWVAFAANGRPDLVVDATPVLYDAVLPAIAAGTYGRPGEAADVLAALGCGDVPDDRHAHEADRLLTDREDR